MKRMIEGLRHHRDDYECMWNGIEDLYVNKTKEHIPNQFFFGMSGFCGFAYIKTNKADIKRMVSFGDGRTEHMYKLLSPVVGFDYHFTACKTPEAALGKAKKEIDAGYPVVIGALDMYYLNYYPKLYHQTHIPFHYILMVGYDDENEVIHLYDCGREERLALSYANLFLAMGANYEGLSKPNTICAIRMESPNSKRHIVRAALQQKASLFVHPPTGFLGVKGMRKLVQELPSWEDELGREDTVRILRRMVEFFGSVPTTPNRLLGIAMADTVSFMCSRDKMGALLGELGGEYKSEMLQRAGALFLSSGLVFEELCSLFVDAILTGSTYKTRAVELLTAISDLEYEAFQCALEGVKLV